MHFWVSTRVRESHYRRPRCSAQADCLSLSGVATGPPGAGTHALCSALSLLLLLPLLESYRVTAHCSHKLIQIEDTVAVSVGCLERSQGC